jgi:hypothetical protein
MREIVIYSLLVLLLVTGIAYIRLPPSHDPYAPRIDTPNTVYINGMAY